MSADVSSLLFLQASLVGLLLTLAGLVRLLNRDADIARTGIAKLAGLILHDPSVAAVRAGWVSLGFVELTLGGWLLSGWRQAVAGAFGVGFGGLSLAYLLWVIKQRQATSCGCFGTGTPVSWRAVVRSGLLIMMTAAYLAGGLLAPASYGRVVVSGYDVLFLLAEAIAIAVLSDELKPFARQMRLDLMGLYYSVRAGVATMSSVRRHLEQCPVWGEVIAGLNGDGISGLELRQSWRHGRWQVLEFGGSWERGDLLVVGAEYLGVQPPWIRIAVIDESRAEKSVVMSWDSVTAAQVAQMPHAHSDEPSGISR